MATRIAVIGSINVDLVTYLRRLPGPGETIEAAGFEMHHGGKGANQAVAAAKLGSDVLMVGQVGADPFGDRALANLQVHGIDTRHVGRAASVSTGVATILVEPSAENRIMIVAGANGDVRPADIDGAAEDLAQCDLMLLQFEIPIETVHHAIRIAAAGATPVILNPAPVRLDVDPEMLAGVAFLVPNRTELAELAGLPVDTREQVEAAARAMLARLSAARSEGGVIATMGADGALAVTASATEHVASTIVQPADTTGAGDAFIGSFAHCYARSRAVADAARQAARYAALSTTRRGAQSSYADAAEFRAFCDCIGQHPTT